MPSIKEEVINLIKDLPDKADYDEIMARIYFKQKVDKSLQQIADGKVVTHKKAKKRISKWIK